MTAPRKRNTGQWRDLALVLAIFMLFGWGAATATAAQAGAEATRLEPPRLFPDYVGVTIPPNIAPLNFKILEPGQRYRVGFRSTKGAPIELTGRGQSVRIPLHSWRTLLQANAGEPLFVDVAVQNAQAGWTRFATVTNRIAKEECDGYLAYRLLKPLYNFYTRLGIYQRDLSSFEQRPILENDRFGGGCLNCHTPFNRRPDTFAFNTRGAEKEQPMILVVSNSPARVDKTMGYLSWHPSGRLLVFSANKLSLFSHTRGETRDVYDAASNLGVYRVDSNLVVFPPAISKPDRNETWPGWSPDGRYLYYSSALPQPIKRFSRIQYDIVRVSYDLEADRWGEPEAMVSAQDTGLSACQPKPSPDGRWLLFTMCKNGNFPIYQSSSDLYLMDLQTRQFHRLDINSDQADSWHSWSSNSRWVAFSSKRIDGLFARPHFTYVDENGEFHKPFVLPQEDPAFYESYLKTFNVPEFMQGPVTVSQKELADTVLRPKNLLSPKGAAPLPGSEVPPGQSIDGKKREPQQMRE